MGRPLVVCENEKGAVERMAGKGELCTAWNLVEMDGGLQFKRRWEISTTAIRGKRLWTRMQWGSGQDFSTN